MIEAILLIALGLLVLSLAGWNIMVHHRLSQWRVQEAAHRAQIEATLQGLARRSSDAEELLRVAFELESPRAPDGETEPSMVLAETEAGSNAATGKGLRPAEAELLAKLARYREQSAEQRAPEDGIAEAV